jgi:GTPase SAR1 family protein
MLLLFVFASFRHETSLSSQAVVLVYDVTRPETFDTLLNWLEHVEDRTSESIAVMVLGNKRDLPEAMLAVPTTRAQAFADQIGALFMEVSANTGSGVAEAF